MISRQYIFLWSTFLWSEVNFLVKKMLGAPVMLALTEHENRYGKVSWLYLYGTCYYYLDYSSWLLQVCLASNYKLQLLLPKVY